MKKNKGFLTVLAVVLITVVSVFGISIVYLFMSNTRAGTDRLLSLQALYLADAGIERATFGLLSPHVTSAVALTQRYSCASTSFSNQSLGTGVFTVASTGTFDITTGLTGAVTSSATTIPVTSTTSFASNGFAMIDKEVVSYSSVNATNLLGVVRGINGTTAVAHDSGARATQYQCSIQSQGGVPNLTSPLAKRVVQDNIQTQKALIAGVNSTGELLAIFNGTTWTRQGPSAGIQNQNFNGIYAINYGDAWAVGNAGVFARFDGTTWSEFVDVGATNFFGVHCIERDDCWAVGSSNQFFRFNGTTWSLFVDLGGDSVLSVFCNTTSDCRAVGASDKFYLWNGTTWAQTHDLGADSVNTVFCNSTTDCWAAGASEKIYRLSAGVWSEFIDMGVDTLNGLYCVNANDCWVVGAARSFARWNGTTWTAVAVTVPNVTYTTVACYNSNDCWAAGASGNIVHWDGSNWSSVTTGLPAVQYNGLTVIGHKTSPNSVWQGDLH